MAKELKKEQGQGGGKKKRSQEKKEEEDEEDEEEKENNDDCDGDAPPPSYDESQQKRLRCKQRRMRNNSGGNNENGLELPPSQFRYQNLLFRGYLEAETEHAFQTCRIHPDPKITKRMWRRLLFSLGEASGVVCLNDDHPSVNFQVCYTGNFSPCCLRFYYVSHTYYSSSSSDSDSDSKTIKKTKNKIVHEVYLAAEKIVVVTHLMVVQRVSFEFAYQIVMHPDLDWSRIRRCFSSVLELHPPTSRTCRCIVQ